MCRGVSQAGLYGDHPYLVLVKAPGATETVRSEPAGRGSAKGGRIPEMPTHRTKPSGGAPAHTVAKKQSKNRVGPVSPRLRNTDPCEQSIGALPERTPAVCTTDDPVEAMERIVSRRKLLIEKGDVFITRAVAPIRATTDRELFVLTRQDIGQVPGRFTKFEQAVAAGDELATRLKVRLYFQESSDHPPHLLKDCRV